VANKQLFLISASLLFFSLGTRERKAAKENENDILKNCGKTDRGTK